MFNWRPKDEFWQWLHGLPQTRNSEQRLLETLAIVSLTEAQLRELAPLPPAETPADDGDFPGPVLRWYGDADGAPAILTHHWGHSWGDYTDLFIERPHRGAPPWTALEPLITHAPELVQRVGWVQYSDVDGQISVFAVGTGAPSVAIYRTASITDANAMVALLSRPQGDWRYEVNNSEQTLSVR